MHRTALSRLIAIITASLMLWACSSSRKASSPGIAGIYSSASDDASSPAAPAWNDLRVPISLNVSKPAALKIGGAMTMVRGSSIHISLRFLGMEVGAAYATTDSVYAYAKLQRVYIAESTRDILGGIGASISDLQALIIGQAIDLPASAGNAAIDVTKLEGTGQPLSITISHSSGRSATLTYTPAEGLPIANDINISAQSGKNEIAASLDYNWGRAQVDCGNEIRFSVPDNYRRINGSALLKALSKM